MYHQGEQHPEKDFWIQKGLASYPQTKYEEVPLSKIIIGTQIVPLGLVKVRTNIPPRVTKNKFNEYLVTDGRHRLFNFYLEHFPLPHEIKVGCLVEFRPADGHYSGYNIWQAAELLHLNPRRSISRRFFNYFGLFRKDYSFFAIDDQTRKDLNHRTKVLLEAVEDELDHLYQDFIKRICEFIMVIRENEKKPQLVKKQFAQYQVLLLRLVNEEKEEESLLNKLLQALKDELSKPQLQDNKQLLHGKTLCAGRCAAEKNWV